MIPFTKNAKEPVIWTALTFRCVKVPAPLHMVPTRVPSKTVSPLDSPSRTSCSPSPVWGDIFVHPTLRRNSGQCPGGSTRGEQADELIKPAPPVGWGPIGGASFCTGMSRMEALPCSGPRPAKLIIFDHLARRGRFLIHVTMTRVGHATDRRPTITGVGKRPSLIRS